MMSFVTFISLLVLFQSVFCQQECSYLEPADMGSFNLSMVDGEYELVHFKPSGFLKDAFEKLVNCNKYELRVHTSNIEDPGFDASMNFYFPKPSTHLLEVTLPHFQTLTEINSREFFHYSRNDGVWRIQQYTFLLATSDAITLQLCSVNENDPTDIRLYIFAFRKLGSTLTVEEVKKLQPESVQQSDDLRIACKE